MKGYKTYIVAFLMVAKAVASYIMGESHSFDAVDWNLVLEGLGLAAVRKGISG